MTPGKSDVFSERLAVNSFLELFEPRSALVKLLGALLGEHNFIGLIFALSPSIPIQLFLILDEPQLALLSN